MLDCISLEAIVSGSPLTNFRLDLKVVKLLFNFDYGYVLGYVLMLALLFQ